MTDQTEIMDPASLEKTEDQKKEAMDSASSEQAEDQKKEAMDSASSEQAEDQKEETTDSASSVKTEDQKEAKVDFEITYVRYLNLSLQQNALPIVQELKLKNTTSEDWKNLTCAFSSEPPIVQPKTIHVELLKANEELSLHDLGITLDYSLLASMSEATKGVFTVEIRQEDNVLAHRDHPVEALTSDQWLGLEIFPELIASFVTPNLDVINHLLGKVADELEKETGNSALAGYQRDKQYVYALCAAIYRAIHSWGIRYATPAASFCVPGQRIRFADTIYQYRLGTCLDTSVLFASVMEQCGLHPVILLQKGHAYVGCHLEDYYFPDIPMEDLQSIRKRVDLDLFLVIETTMVTSDATFSQAEATARAEHLNIDQDFECAVDIMRARHSGIRPLPLKQSTNGIEFLPPERHVAELDQEKKRDLQQEIDLSTLKAAENRVGRLERWTQKLLDLSLRNRLLNVRDSKQVIPIACSNISKLEDLIAAGEAISLKPLDDLLGEKDLHDLNMLRGCEVKSEITELLDNELRQRRLWAMLSPVELGRNLLSLYRQGQTDLSEGGVNTLFLAVGFLEWKVSPRDERSYLAPILLIPVRLVRKSLAEGIRISRLDEDTVLNETLLELLRSQYQLRIPGLSPLPTDESGVDVPRVMQIIRQTIKEMRGWEVREEAKLGHFSFGKFIMWNDMTARSDALRQNPLVNHLMLGDGLYDDGVEVFPPEKIGEHLSLDSLFCPMSADSSQLTAVLYSQLGKSFVLHGPPGTGKSQTITNIIAQNLALGRRVLFVSEKKAALDVVHKRLTAIGLRPFCLELHSNKSGKSEVLAQFSEALNVAESGIPGEWESTIQEMQQVREELNAYVNGLHQTYPNGFSAYDCFSRLMQEGREMPSDLLEIDCLTQPKAEYEVAKQRVSDLVHAWSATNAKALASLSWLNSASWSPVLEKDITAAAKELVRSADHLSACFQEQSAAYCLSCPGTLPRINAVAVLAEALASAPDTPEAFLAEDSAETMSFLLAFSEVAQKRATLREELQPYHLELLKTLDPQGIEARIHQNAQNFFLFRFFKNRALLQELSSLKKLGGTKLTISELLALLPKISQWFSLESAYERDEEQAKALLGKFWNHGNPDWATLQSRFENAKKIGDAVDSACGDTREQKGKAMAFLQSVLPKAEKYFAKDGAPFAKIQDFLSAWSDFLKKREAFASYAQGILAEENLERIREQTKSLLDNITDLRGVLRYRKAYDSVQNLGLNGLVQAIQQGEISPKEGVHTFDLAYLRRMLDQLLATSSVLSEFSALNQEQRIQKFCELDQRYQKLTKKMVFAKLAAALPRRRTGACPEGTELGILKRECEKRARQKPVRQLLEQIPTLAPVLKPCFLMSPLSVAQYLPPDTSPFDLIVFDEASQIPVWDAVGVIARGKQLIVVGDPKQMPPTNFFQKGDVNVDDTGSEEMEDMESILDECLAAGIPSAHLNWHYRSRHESLISFSNHYYYEDKLFTFPSARLSERLGVCFQFVPGAVYDRKGTRTNTKEAQALVRYVFTQLKNSPERKRSVGIVTFSEAQRNLIEDMIEKKRADYPELESYFNDQNDEPLFVKNLENVQGDERDVILFSVCYAPDSEGKFSMNFGPLNRQGGERRLNVAITRAKEQVVVFASVHAQDLDLARTRAVGAAHLKYFLEYAEKGSRIQGGAWERTEDNGMSELIADFLKRNGYDVDRDVGCSGYKIDIAVRNPARPKEYLLAIECDGKSYAAQRTTRDRDHLRDSVLHSLGWHTYRAWSVDWFYDRDRTQQTLLQLLEDLCNKPQTEGPEQEKEDGVPQETAPVGQEGEAAAPPPSPPEHRKTYVCCQLVCDQPQENFYAPETKETLREQFCQIIQTEAPIYEKVLRKRLASAWGFNRTGNEILRILKLALPGHLQRTKVGEDYVFWAETQNPAHYQDYRIPGPDGYKRAIDEIPPEELANAMREVHLDFHSCTQDVLYRETLKRLGFASVTEKARKYLDIAFAALKKSNEI